jgi:hypothetical protein
MVLFLKLRDPLFEYHILFLKMYQEDILLKDALDGLDDERGGFLKRGAELYQKSIEKVDSFSLFYPQRHHDQGRQQKDDDESGYGISSKEEKGTYPHQSSILECHAME